jgi:2-polyprenyl-3-methyl-5-hydroxy-6-metoxy-1,4-benzoquinol methylase
VTPRSAGDVDRRARLSLGRSHQAIYDTVAALLAARAAGGDLADVGCGRGDLWRVLRGRFRRCVALDAVRYDELPGDVDFHRADFDSASLPLPDGSADAVVAVEVIEHLENPRAFVRELTRITRPGGWILVTTPNQLSLLSLLTLVVKGRFSAFQDNTYPAHRTALLDVDLRRIMTECGLSDIAVEYTGLGRLPLSEWHYPAAIAALSPRRFSDNVLAIARR